MIKKDQQKAAEHLSVKIPADVMARVRACAKEEMRAMSNMAMILIIRGLDDMGTRTAQSGNKEEAA